MKNYQETPSYGHHTSLTKRNQKNLVSYHVYVGTWKYLHKTVVLRFSLFLGIIEVNEEEEEDDEESPEDSLEDDSTEDKILEEDIIGPSAAKRGLERRNSRRSSEEDLPRQPCSFFISTSPPLQNMVAPSITSELVSTLFVKFVLS